MISPDLPVTNPTPSPATRAARVAALSGYFGLLGLLFLWYAWLAPSTRFPVALSLVVVIGPLLFPLRGILYGRPYTHAWTSFLALFYFVLGVGVVWVDRDERWFGILQVAFSVLLYVGAMLYARWRGRELKTPSAE